ncbi:MAG: DUF1080 domain-containing protein [Daejeonella sp.]|uniref:3-keto-disaccharide hydrolase n=1 Tax=Daejeonella sp. TaxID=2805397 RepID=UPI003C76F112
MKSGIKIWRKILPLGVAVVLLTGTGQVFGQTAKQMDLNSLSAFKDPSKSWQIVSGVKADLTKPNVLTYTDGSGVLLNLPDKRNKGEDLYTIEEFGDMDLELDYLIAPGSNSGIYLQGRYEIQLMDTWGATIIRSGSNGGIYERWDDSKPEGQKGYSGYAPRQNASRAPGLWQKLKISFQAPRFDADGNKIQNAVMLRVEMNGTTIHDNVELTGVTRGSMSQDEKATGPLRIQGDHGPVAFRNIKITRFDTPRALVARPVNPDAVDPILIDATENTVIRSFMDVPGGPRVVHAVSVGSPSNVHYTYDMDNASLVQVWRGGFLNATPMWHSRGDGSSRPQGTVQRFGKMMQSLARLENAQANWPADTTGTSYRQKGYVLDVQGQPAFKYMMHGSAITDFTRVMNDGRGLTREIKIENPAQGLFFRLANGASIEETSPGLYLIDNQSYYLRLENGAKAVLRDRDGGKELIIPAGTGFSYSILF